MLMMLVRLRMRMKMAMRVRLTTRRATCKLAFSALSFARSRLANPPHSCNSAYCTSNEHQCYF